MNVHGRTFTVEARSPSWSFVEWRKKKKEWRKKCLLSSFVGSLAHIRVQHLSTTRSCKSSDSEDDETLIDRAPTELAQLSRKMTNSMTQNLRTRSC